MAVSKNSRKTANPIPGNKPFKKGAPSPNPKGRPKKLLGELSETLRAEGFEPLKPSQIAEALCLLLNLTEERLKDLSTDRENSIFVRIIAKKLIDRATDYSVTTDLLDRVLGKPKNALDLTATGQVDVPILNIPRSLTMDEWIERYHPKEDKAIQKDEEPKKAEPIIEETIYQPAKTEQPTKPRPYVLGDENYE